MRYFTLSSISVKNTQTVKNVGFGHVFSLIIIVETCERYL